MIKLFLYGIFSVLLSGMLFAQNKLILTFQAEEILSGDPVALDSVYVKNLDKDCDTTLYGSSPDLLIYVISGLNNQPANPGRSIVYPNPFHGSTRLSINVSEPAGLALTLFDLQGRTLYSSRMETLGGIFPVIVHTAKKISILKVEGKNINTSFTLINLAPEKENSVEPGNRESGMLKRTAKNGGFQYQIGDQLLMAGYADGYFPDSLFDSPSTNTPYTFQMEQLPPPTPPEVLTLHITEILHTSVTGGGEVIHDGWSPVTARGLCWSTGPQPTIADNYTTEGSGTGTYVSTMTGLDTNTTYYVRAYATNAIGTSYGEEMGFTSKSDIPCPGIPTVTYGGQQYETVLIGTQCWMKEHMNIGTMILDNELPEDNGLIEKWCYDDDPVNCSIYGGLYNWYEVMQYDTLPGSKGICPSGWHIPTDEEISTLEGTADSQYPVGDPIWNEFVRGFDVGLNLKSSAGWVWGNGNDVYGFNGLPAGYRWPNGGFTQIQEVFTLWSSSEAILNVQVLIRDFRHSMNQTLQEPLSKIQGYSVRCVFNETFN